MALIDLARQRPFAWTDIVADALRRFMPQKPVTVQERRFAAHSDLKRRQRAAEQARHAGLVEQVIEMLCDGIEHPHLAAVDDIRSNLLHMAPGQLRGMKLTMKNRPVFVPMDDIESDVIGMLRGRIRG